MVKFNLKRSPKGRGIVSWGERILLGTGEIGVECTGRGNGRRTSGLILQSRGYPGNVSDKGNGPYEKVGVK